MMIYNVGPDAAYSEPSTDESYVWLVYWYEEGCYDGWGEAVALDTDGKLYCYDLSHCSCYGPFDDWGINRHSVSVEEFFRTKTNIHDRDYKDEIAEKVAELLGWIRE
jgi:hypothetical protein